MGRSRNTDEFVRLFSLYTNNIYSYVHVLVPTHADAEDVFQETSRTLWQKFGEYRPGADDGFRAWALRIAQIEVLRYRQREGRRQQLFSRELHELLDESALAAVGSMDWRFEALGDCYRKLSEEDRQLLDARYQAGSTVEAIAAAAGRSVHSVYRALRRIHESLFDCVRQEAEKGTGPICRNGPEGASHKLDLSPFPRKEATP
jgi:RNA polymerase sigma-70 factor (ECF subfamily)